MTSTSALTASALALALSYFRQASGFVAPGTAAAAAGPDISVDMRRFHRVEQPSLERRRRGAPRLSMLKGDSDSDLGRDNDDLSGGGSSDASTRLEFGAGLGAAAAAVVLGRTTATVAEDASTAVVADAAAAGVTDAAQEYSPEVAAPSPAAVASTSTAETRPLRELGFEVPYTGKSFPLSKFLGSRATLVVNPKIDDPESLHQMPGITKLASEYSKDGLNVLLFPTDQGTFEADEDRVVRIKLYQFYGFGQFPKAVVFDKIDIVGNTIHPFYRYLCRGLKNPNGIARITLNYEKFLLDQEGKVVRRYPRKLEAADFEADVKAVLAGDPLPAENRDYKLSWLKADQEATKSEYAFKLGLNYYNN